ncbi:hypothetical protein, partial [Vibrio parahaemolyticus]|uniref:hypothetical protein n=1 Tax=Vibrio parahaemolyticus TaxID=670 RepID=UPI0009B23040
QYAFCIEEIWASYYFALVLQTNFVQTIHDKGLYNAVSIGLKFSTIFDQAGNSPNNYDFVC